MQLKNCTLSRTLATPRLHIGSVPAAEHAGRATLRQSDTDAKAYDTGAFGSAGTVAGFAVQAACRELRADLPVTEVYFADTHDVLGPFGDESMSESPYNPVAPAMANAMTRACGARLRQLPMTPARVWRALQ